MGKKKDPPPEELFRKNLRENFAKIEAMNMKRLADRFKAGQTLSQAEMKALRDYQSEPEAGPLDPAVQWVSSDAKLSALFGPHRASFPRFRKNYPDAPKARDNGEHSVPAWQKFFEEHPEALDRSSSEGRLPALRERKLMEEIRALLFANDLAEAKFLPKAEVETFLLDLAEKIKAILHKKLKNELPPKLEGLRAPEMAAKMDPMILEICQLLRNL